MSNRLMGLCPRELTLLALTGAASLALCGTAGGATSGLPALDISLSPTAITVSGATQAGAVNIVVTAAKGLKEPTPALLLLKPGSTPADVEAFLMKNHSDPNAIGRFGSIVLDAEAAAGGTSEVQTVLAPGNYLALNVEGEPRPGAPHATFTVAPSAAPAELPAPAAVVRTIDFAFKGPRTLKSGSLVRFENEGFLVHMDIAFPVRSRRAALAFAADLRSGRNKAAERLVAGPPLSLQGPVSPGAVQQGVLSARTGWYVQACFMDTQDGREHTRLGMERVIRVVR